MKLQFYKNIDVVQINIKEGVSEYYFPQNVDWADKKIDKMLVYATNPQNEDYSPFDGVTPIVDLEQFGSVYLDLYADDNTQIAYNLAANNILYTNNNPLEINSKLSLQTSKIGFTNPPETDCCVLIYVFWNTRVVDACEMPKRSVTVRFQVPGNTDVKLADVIDSYILAQGKTIKGILYWAPPMSWQPVHLTLRDTNYQTIVKSLPVYFCRPPMGLYPYYDGGPISVQAQSIQTHPLYLDAANVDFENSFAYGAWENQSSSADIILTFLY